MNFEDITLEQLAAIVSKKLREHGIDSVLVGGACATIYSHNQYQSYDLDYVTYEDMKKVTKALKEIGFHKRERYYVHPKCKYFVEFVSPPVSIGDEPINQFELYQTHLGTIKMLTPTDSVKDRLASFYYWDDQTGLDQAVAISKASKEEINISELKRWSKKENNIQKFSYFLKKLNVEKS